MAPDVHEPQPGTIVGDKYRLLHLIGRGGFGLVYQAHSLAASKDMALKLLLPRWAQQDPEIAIRFRREAVLASQLRHPNTITLYDYGHTKEGILYMAMEYVDGITLSMALREQAPIPHERVRNILSQILASLEEAHERGIIHRDLKPGNIMLARQGAQREFVKVLDFGIAKAISPDLLEGQDGISQTLTQAGQFCGTPRYMAPEQFRGGSVTPSCDLYSLGLIAYELLTGEPALKGETMVDLIVQQVAGPSLRLPRSVNIPWDFREAIHQALQKNPEDRWKSATEFLRALQDPTIPSARELLSPHTQHEPDSVPGDHEATLNISSDKASLARKMMDKRPTAPALKAVSLRQNPIPRKASPSSVAHGLNAPLDTELAPTALQSPFSLDPDSSDTLDHSSPMLAENTIPHDFSQLTKEVSYMSGGAASQDHESPSIKFTPVELLPPHLDAEDGFLPDGRPQDHTDELKFGELGLDFSDLGDSQVTTEVSYMNGGVALPDSRPAPPYASALGNLIDPDDLATTEMVRDHYPNAMDNEATLDISQSVLFAQELEFDAGPTTTIPKPAPLQAPKLPPLPVKEPAKPPKLSPAQAAAMLAMTGPDATVDMQAMTPPGDQQSPRYSEKMKEHLGMGPKGYGVHTIGPPAKPDGQDKTWLWDSALPVMSAALVTLLLALLVFAGANLVLHYLPEDKPVPVSPITSPPQAEDRHEQLQDPSIPSVAIRIESEPPQADVLVHGEVVGRTPMTLVRSQGIREQIRVRKSGHLEYAREINFSRDETLPIVLNKAPKP